MSDPMMQKPQMPQQGMPQGAPPSPVTKNLSMFNGRDAGLMQSTGQLSPNMSVRQFLEAQGVDVEGPVTQLVDMAKKQVENANPMNKMRNIAADTALQKGGQPNAQPGVKPMVAPPGQPSPAGMEGLINKLGGK